MAGKKRDLSIPWPFAPAAVKLNGDTGLLKLVAMAAMLCDHMGKMFFPQYGAMRVIGRIAFPIYAYCIAVGCVYTRNPLNYLRRIVALALILVVVVFGMYFADQAIEGGFAPYRFISEKVPFIGEYLPATEQAPALADPATLTGNDADMNGGADVAATDEPEVTSEPDNVTDGASDEGVTTDETEPESVG